MRYLCGEIVPFSVASPAVDNPSSFFPMARVFPGLFLIVFDLNLLFGLNIPIWVTGLLVPIAGVLLFIEYFRFRVETK